jgi:hypothetical protein
MTTLSDLTHYIGGDLSPSATGDLQTATNTLRGQQRVLRRLLTNPGDYIFHPDYGAGLPAHVGRVTDIHQMTALVRGQVLKEDAVSKTPPPLIKVKSLVGGGVAVSIRYTDAASGQPVVLNFNVGQ